MDAKQEHTPERGNEANPYAPPAGAPPNVELKTHASSGSSPGDAGEDTGIPLKTKPLPRVNAAAREIRVKFTGTRVGSAFI